MNDFFSQVIRLDYGEPSFPPPKEVKSEAIKYITNGYCEYEEPSGNGALRHLITLQTHPEINSEQIVITSGGLMALNSVISALSKKGIKNVYFPDPGFPPYQEMDRISNINLIPYKYDTKEVFLNSLSRYTDKEKAAFIITSPNNPNGLVLSNSEWDLIFEKLRDHYIIVDDSFVNFLFSDDDTSLKLGENVFRVFSFSKTYSMADFRVGYIITPNSEWAKNISEYIWNFQLSTSTVSQRAAIGALRAKSEYLDESRNFVLKNMLTAIKELKLKGIDAKLPAGGFFLWIDIRKTGLSSIEFVDICRESYYVSVMPGSAFGSSGEGFIRINCATESISLKEGIKRFIHCYEERLNENERILL
ncbi:pyridoxal phosphate-dependent aminotransferase [Mesobacillus thioparans]|uniref:pyridoxal phosphate-dependent aminotransferase n=1 Tax=Mesobacillus thioparans TaxID=370439 RepID=UPI0039EFE9EC